MPKHAAASHRTRLSFGPLRPRHRRARQRRHVPYRLMAVVAAMGLVAITTSATSPAAVGPHARLGQLTSSAGSWSATSLPLASGETTTYLNAISCTSTTACVAVGDPDSTSTPVTGTPVAETLSGTTWTATNLPLPSGDSSTLLNAVSCTAATACVAVGEAVGTSGGYTPVAETLSGTTWTAVNLTDASGTSNNVLNGISCTSATACVAVGTAFNSSTETPVAETLSGTTWTAANLPIASGHTNTELSAVSCNSATACVAVGYTVTNATPVADTLSSTTWAATNLPLPSGYSSYVYLYGVACTSSTACTAAGYNSNDDSPVAETLSGTTWTVSNLQIPSGHSSTDLFAVSCSSATACVAVGHTSSGTPVADTLSGTTWTAANLPIPSGSSTAYLGGISCTTATACVAAGGSNNSPDQIPLAETLMPPPTVEASPTLSWSATLSMSNQSPSTSTSMTINYTGSAGWTLQMSATVPTNAAGQTLPELAVGDSAGWTISCTNGSGTCVLPTGSTSTTNTTLSTTLVTLYTAPAGTGTGGITIDYPVIVSLPANAYAGTYTSTITVSLG